MPITIEQDGQQVEVFTAAELATQTKDAAEKAAADAARTTEDRVKAELASDPNGVAAAARRDAEKKVRTAEKEVETAKAELEAALVNTGKSAEEIKALQEQVKTAKAAEAKAAEDVSDVKADFARKTALIEAGAKPVSVAKVEALLKADGIDIADAAAVKTALEQMRTDAPGLFAGTKEAGYNPNRGSSNPPRFDGAPTPEQIEAMTPAEYQAWRTKK